MIYIFEDRLTRRNNNERQLLNKYSDCVNFVDIKADQTIEDWVWETMGISVECICFHKSYQFKEKMESLQSSIKYLKELGTPIVVYSGGTEKSSKGPDRIHQMNAEQMYFNLPFFLDHFKQYNEVNIDTLLWGESSELNNILNFQNKLAKQFLVKANLMDQIKYIYDVIDFIEIEGSNLPKSIIDHILTAVNIHQTLTWQKLADILDETIQNFK